MTGSTTATSADTGRRHAHRSDGQGAEEHHVGERTPDAGDQTPEPHLAGDVPPVEGAMHAAARPGRAAG